MSKKNNLNFLFEVTATCKNSEIELIESDMGKNGGPTKVVFKSRLQTANEKNQNGRVYDASVCRSIVSQLAPKAKSRALIF